MKRLPLLPIVAAGLLAPSAASAQGAPFTVSNPGTGDETEFKVDGDFRTRGDRDVATAKMELTIPVVDRVEISFQVQHRTLHRRRVRTESGFGDVSIASKFYLLKPEESALGLDIGIEPELSFPTGSARRGLGAGKVEFTVPLMIVKAFGPLKIGTELGYTRLLGDDEDQGSAAFLAMYRVAPQWRIGAEVAVRAPHFEMAERSTDLNLGFKFDASSRFQLYGLFGQGIERPNGDSEQRARVGIRLAFGGAARPAGQTLSKVARR